MANISTFFGVTLYFLLDHLLSVVLKKILSAISYMLHGISFGKYPLTYMPRIH
jgi:hypothetical protein